MRPLVLHSHLSGTASSCLYETSSGNCTKAQTRLGTPLTGTVMVLMKMLFMIYTKMKGTISMPKKRQQYCLSNFSLLNISSSGNGTILRPGARYQAIQHHQAFKLFFFVENVDIAFFERKFSIQGKYSSGRLWEMHVMETPEEVFGNG